MRRVFLLRGPTQGHPMQFGRCLILKIHWLFKSGVVMSYFCLHFFKKEKKSFVFDSSSCLCQSQVIRGCPMWAVSCSKVWRAEVAPWRCQQPCARSECWWWPRKCFPPQDPKLGGWQRESEWANSPCRRQPSAAEMALYGSLLGNGHFIFCVCASKGPCQHTFTHTTLSATVFDRLHCKEAACNSFFVPVYILDCLLVTLLFWSLGEYLIHNHIFLEIILFPASYVKAN